MNENKNKQDPETPAPQTPDDESQSLEETIRKIKPYIDKLWAKRKQFLIFNGAVAVLSVLYLLFLTKPYYTSTVSILPKYGNQSSMLSSISGLASMAGINVGDVPPNEIYKKILMSEKVIKDVVHKKYLTDEYPDSVNLIDYFEIESSDNKVTNYLNERERFIKIYKIVALSKLKMEVDRITTVLSLTVEMPEPKLSAEVANALADALNKYVTTERQSFAREQSEYLLNRITKVKDSLMLHENRLKEFREKNRAINNSPQLTLEQNRLVRKVELAQSVYIELTKQYELVKLEEVKDTPIINIMEKAEQPVKKAGPKRLNILIIWLIISSFLSAIYIVLKDDLKKILDLFKRS